MTEPFDLDAFIAEAEAEAEVKPSPFTFVFGGDEYEMPPSIDIRAIGAFTAGRIDDAMRILLGVDQWAQMQSTAAVFDTKALTGLFAAYAKHSGLELPNSSGSTSSSPSTAGPSKRTSNGRTTPRLRDSSRAS